MSLIVKLSTTIIQTVSQHIYEIITCFAKIIFLYLADLFSLHLRVSAYLESSGACRHRLPKIPILSWPYWGKVVVRLGKLYILLLMS
jgi:hypothetical protein